MESISPRQRNPIAPFRKLLALVCAALLAGGEGALLAQEAAPAKPATEKRSPEQLDSLVAPIALYPDPLLAQTLVAATYPLEVIQLQQWLAKNPALKDKALADAVAKQPWDPAIQSMAAVPEVVKRLAEDIQWTTQLGDAFLDQQSEVMDAVQRMRKKAQDKGTLTSNEQMKVETKVVEEKTVIVVEQTNPQVVYVPSYDPVVVYGPAYSYYPYPPIYYPPYYGGAWISFGVGMFWGAAIWGGSCCGCSWGGGRHQHKQQQQLQQELEQKPGQPARRRRESRRRSRREQKSGQPSGRQSRRQRQMVAQPPASRRHAVLEQGSGEQVRRVDARRFARQPSGGKHRQPWIRRGQQPRRRRSGRKCRCQQSCLWQRRKPRRLRRIFGRRRR